MSIEAKTLLIHEFGEKLSPILSAADRDTVLAALSETLVNYGLEHLGDVGSDFESEELLEAYISAKRIEGRSEKTLERYQYIIHKMMDAIPIPIRSITVFHIRKYFSAEKDRGISDRTLEGTREVLSAYFGWLHKEGLLQANPIVNLGSIKYPKVTRLPYSDVDIEQLKESCDCIRDKAIISFLLSTGCRISEVCALNRQDIDFEKRECIVFGKGSKERIVYLDDVTVMQLKRYLGSRKDDNEALFVGKRKNRLTPSGVRAMLKRVSGSAGVNNTHPHRFRRTLATNLIDHGMPIQEVAAVLGHDKIDTTMGYVYIDRENVKNSYNKYR